MTLQELAAYNQALAWKVIEDTQVVSIWESIGAEVNLVGSLKSGLLVKNRDIDFHIYTDEFTISESFAAMQKLAEHPRIKEILYKNLIDTEEECMEWHAWYEDQDHNLWQIDMIHIRKGSRYDGVVEKVTDAIIHALTPETKKSILQIKFDMPDGVKVPGIEIYRAVLSGGVRTWDEFAIWKKKNPLINGLDWMP